MSPRLIVGGLLGAGFAALMIVMNLGQNTGGPGSSGGRPFEVDPRSCQACHQEIYDQWWNSQHRKSFTNPDVVQGSNKYAQKNCVPCHAPRPIFELGVRDAEGTLIPARARSTYREHGVSCQTCHLLPRTAKGSGGKPMLLGSRNLPVGVCALPVRKRPDLRTSDFCGACHNQHETLEQWRATPYSHAGENFRSCMDCHFEKRVFSPARGVAPRLSFDHSSPGSHDPKYIASALDFSAELEADEIQIAITNARAGHHYPTEERSRASDVFISYEDEQGTPIGQPVRLYRFRDPYRGEQGVPRTLLEHGETKSLSVKRGDWPAGAKKAIVVLDYRRRPTEPLPDTHKYTLFRKVIDLH